MGPGWHLRACISEELPVKEGNYSVTPVKDSEADFIQGRATELGVVTPALESCSRRERLGSTPNTLKWEFIVKEQGGVSG